MTQNRDFFTPESVDEQVERLSSHPSDKPAYQAADAAPSQAETRLTRDFSQNEDGQSAPEHLVKDLQVFYQADYKQNIAALARARQRIAAHQSTSYAINQGQSPLTSAPVQHLPKERTRKMQSLHSVEQPAARTRFLSLLAATLVTGLLVGTMAIILTLNHNQRGNPNVGSVNATMHATPTPVPVPVGRVLFTKIPPAGTNLSSPAWSPDGSRLAAQDVNLTTNMTQLYIWDGTNGKKLRTIPLNTASFGNVLWSPTGKYLALYNLQTIVIVDSQSGTIVKTINYTPPAAFSSPTSSHWLASNSPLGGGYGFYSAAWTPDGASLAVAVSDTTTGKVVLLDPRTGNVKTTFNEQARTIGDAMSISDDGKYLAVSYSNDSTIVVWDVATQQATFVLNGAQSMTIAWQPGTHNLARSTATSVELWNVNTQKLLKTYKDVTAFAWSPDGKKLVAYSSFFTPPVPQAKLNQAFILDADSGDQEGSYTSKNEAIISAAWSPKGHSIATWEHLSNNNQIVVWTA